MMKLKHLKSILPMTLLLASGFAQATPAASNNLELLWEWLFSETKPLVCESFPSCEGSPVAPEKSTEQQG